MLRNKVFGAYESDLEFQLVHFASMPLYKEIFDPDAGLKSSLSTVYVAESHSEAQTSFCYMREKLQSADQIQMIFTRRVKSTLIIGMNCI